MQRGAWYRWIRLALAALVGLATAACGNVVTRKGTPPTIAGALRAAFKNAITAPAVWNRLADLSFSRDSMTPAQFNTYIKAEIDRF